MEENVFYKQSWSSVLLFIPCSHLQQALNQDLSCNQSVTSEHQHTRCTSNSSSLFSSHPSPQRSKRQTLALPTSNPPSIKPSLCSVKIPLLVVMRMSAKTAAPQSVPSVATMAHPPTALRERFAFQMLAVQLARHARVKMAEQSL